ncbi:hypothetical protein F5B22DRAFT_602675 [Xylaria bambusicola]|uniref:uncharacterized protein n=1 Tax=Xylaria bambusicola TaxID=326684 RepID=UPI002007B885|nr:uncharacterized protein F5B22DRAFT_602675 [Xylaria bambusicola]KAI0517837.1 hypothetical protein F5B22DRAFT_602675 [Xylaria bambusicola]
MSTMNATVNAKLIGVLENHYRPMQEYQFDKEAKKWVYIKRTGASKPTKCLFLTDDGFLKWVAVNAGVFQGHWYNRDTSHLVFPCFPIGSWNFGQIRRLDNGEVGFSQTSEKTLVGIENAWHPTKIDFTEFELINQFGHFKSGRLWLAKHSRFNEQLLFVKIEPWASSWSIKSMENETRVYERTYGLNLTPPFLGHVTYNGAIIGYVLEYLEGAKTTKKEDKYARIKAVKKLHALGISHGCAHHANFLKVGKNMLMIDFQESKFDEKATEKSKLKDIRRIKHIRTDMFAYTTSDDGYVEETSQFDDMIDDEIDWTDDSTDSERDDLNKPIAEPDDSDYEFGCYWRPDIHQGN